MLKIYRKTLFVATILISLNLEKEVFANIITMTDIGTLGGDASVATGVSDDGLIVVGQSLDIDGNDNAFKYDGSTMVSLGDLGGGYSYARAVSGDGLIVVGESTTAEAAFHAFKYDGSTMTDLGDLGGDYSIAYGASYDGSIIVGESSLVNDDIHAFKYEGSTMTDIGTLGGSYSSARAISGDGSVIVGNSTNGLAQSRAFKYVDSTMSDLGVLDSDTYSVATGVSYDGSVIVGYSGFGFGANKAFKYVDSTMVNIGTLGGSYAQANAVSADGSVIVGSSYIAGDAQSHAFKYEGSTMTDLGTLGGTTSTAYGVSADGLVIVGKSATQDDEEYHAFVYRDRLVDVNNTETSLYYNAAQLNSLINLKRSLIINNLKQDCKSFGVNNLCLGVGARYSEVSKNNAREQAGILKVAYKFNNNFRAGILLDQTLDSDNPTNFKTSNNLPMVMLFANLGENEDGSGLNLRLSGSYSKSSLDIVRTIFLDNTEAGSGSADITSKAFLGQISYGKKLGENLSITPNLGILYSQIARDSYSETSGADFPIYYEKMKQSSTAAIASVNINFNAAKNLDLKIGGGLEHNLQSKIDGYAGNISYMGAFDIESPHITRNRIFANIGSTYSIAGNKKITSSIYYGKQQFNNADAAIVYLGYVAGF